MNEESIIHFFGATSALTQFAILFGKTHQIKLMIKSRTTENVSLPMFSLILFSCVTYFIYGLLIADVYVYGPQMPSIMVVSTIIGLYFRNRNYPIRSS
ncbi:MAG: SemiSWEET family transporter [Patescibacteria group bacterium]